jgi:hypothetical protein
MRIISLSFTQKIIVTIVSIILISTLIFLIFPSKRTGPLGFGLPSPIEEFISENEQFRIDHPHSWIVSETANGSHGDAEIIAEITVPGRSFPHVTISSHQFSDANISKVVEWGKSRAQNRNNYAMESLKTKNSENLNGFLHEYTWTSETLFGTVELYCKDLYTLIRDKGYALTFCMYSQDNQLVEDVIEEMISSFYVK